jgi:hypothetical protein
MWPFLITSHFTSYNYSLSVLYYVTGSRYHKNNQGPSICKNLISKTGKTLTYHTDLW